MVIAVAKRLVEDKGAPMRQLEKRGDRGGIDNRIFSEVVLRK